MANKEASVAEMTDKFRTSNAVLLTEYRGLTVAQLKSLRQSISEHATYAVVKNTLTILRRTRQGSRLSTMTWSDRPPSHSYTVTPSPSRRVCATLPRQTLCCWSRTATSTVTR